MIPFDPTLLGFVYVAKNNIYMRYDDEDECSGLKLYAVDSYEYILSLLHSNGSSVNLARIPLCSSLDIVCLILESKYLLHQGRFKYLLDEFRTVLRNSKIDTLLLTSHEN